MLNKRGGGGRLLYVFIGPAVLFWFAALIAWWVRGIR